jgi:hypothetical protein
MLRTFSLLVDVLDAVDHSDGTVGEASIPSLRLLQPVFPTFPVNGISHDILWALGRSSARFPQGLVQCLR